jgi:hypothetical protein
VFFIENTCQTDEGNSTTFDIASVSHKVIKRNDYGL